MTADIFFDIIDKSHINKCASLSFQCQIQGMEEVGVATHQPHPPPPFTTLEQLTWQELCPSFSGGNCFVFL